MIFYDRYAAFLLPERYNFDKAMTAGNIFPDIYPIKEATTTQAKKFHA